MELKALRDVMSEELLKIAELDRRIIVLDADLATSTKVNTFQQRFPERFFQMGVAEQNMIGTAAGLSTLGFVPFTSTFACFLAKRALDQIRVSVAQPALNVKLLGTYGGLFTGKTGKTHQTVQDIAIMRTMPNMRVLVPGDAIEMKETLRASVEYEGPVYLRIARDPSPVFMPSHYRFQWGEPFSLRKGSDLTLISTGIFTAKALEVAERLRKAGVECGVEHLASLKPIHTESIARIARESRRLVTLENHSIMGGLGGAIAEIVCEEHPVLMKRLGVRDTFCESGSNEDLACKYGVDENQIYRECLEFVRKG